MRIRTAWGHAARAGLSVIALGGCDAGARAVAPRVPLAAATTPAVSEAAAEVRAPELPFRMPCAADDVDGCTKGCDEKITEDCVSLASMYLAGSGVAPDHARAIDMFRSACNAGSARGCLRFGDVVHAGLVSSDEKEADYYRRACEGGANLGCVAAAHAYLEGRGVGADPVFAASLLGKVCQRGNAPACLELAALYVRGEGVERDARRAQELREKACRLGLDEACLGGEDVLLPPR